MLHVSICLQGDTPSPSPSVTPQPPTTTDKSTVNVVAIVSGGVIALIAIIVVIFVFIVIIVCCNRRASSKGITFSPSADSQYVDDNDALYTVVSPKDMPPPLPSRPIPGTYASIDSKDNGHMELVAMGSPTLRNSIISMPAEFGTPQSDHMLAKLNINANGQSFPPLRNNPLYSSADNLIRPTAPPPLPDKRGSGSPGSFDEETNLNIYAIPHKPPPLPDRVLSPEPTVPGPIYSEASLSLAQFQSTTSSSSASASVESPDSTSSKICPYASIYADPKPLLKEEGPLEVRPYHIRELRSLGTGQFGQVMLAETLGLSMRDLKLGDSTDKSVSIKVAVKRLKHDADRMVKEAFEKEIKFMARLNHMNVIRMLAICPTGHPFMLMEYMEYGDLNQYLQQYKIAPPGTDPTPSQIQIPSLLYACVQISNGMRYLASLHFIHRDLASRNFLVGKDNSIKIADFGMSRSLYSSHYYRIQGRAILPIRWMATECFYGRFSEKTDVWAFGVAMWEVFTLAKEQPYDDLSDQQVIENAVNTEEIKLLRRPQYCPEEVYEVMLQCWERDPEKRIDFEDIYSSLAALHSYSDM